MRFVDDDSALVERFYRGIYLDAFASQREPLETWRAALRGEYAYAMHARIALDGDDLVGGVTYELYPRSRVGLVTYMVVAPHARERGLGQRLLDDAVRELYAAGAQLVVGEVNDPRVHGEQARPRLDRFVRWGAQQLDIQYVQPALGPGLVRDTGLCLIALPPVPAVIDSIVVRAFIDELYEATEG